MSPVRLDAGTSQSKVKHSTTEPRHSYSIDLIYNDNEITSFLCNIVSFKIEAKTWPEVARPFSCLTQLSMKF